MRMDPQRLTLLRTLMEDAVDSVKTEQVAGEAVIENVTIASYALLMQAPELANELLVERDYLVEVVHQVRRLLERSEAEAWSHGVFLPKIQALLGPEERIFGKSGVRIVNPESTVELDFVSLSDLF